MSQSLPIPPNEEERLKALASYQIMDTLAEKEFDNLTRIASHIFDAPIALITLLDDERQWFKSKIGLEAEGTPREVSFCQYAIVDGETLIVNDAHEDKRFEDNPLVTGNPNIRFYAGHPITNEQGHRLGTLCVVDDKPRSVTPKQIELLKGLAKSAMSLIACRKANYRLEIYKRFFDESLNLMCIVDMQGVCQEVNPFFMKKLDGLNSFPGHSWTFSIRTIRSGLMHNWKNLTRASQPWSLKTACAKKMALAFGYNREDAGGTAWRPH